MEVNLLIERSNLNSNSNSNTSEIYLTELKEGDEYSLYECMETDDISKYTLRIPYPYKIEDGIYWINYCKQQTIEPRI